jgi:hypothetical protein
MSKSTKAVKASNKKFEVRTVNRTYYFKAKETRSVDE